MLVFTEKRHQPACVWVCMCVGGGGGASYAIMGLVVRSALPDGKKINGM